MELEGKREKLDSTKNEQPMLLTHILTPTTDVLVLTQLLDRKLGQNWNLWRQKNTLVAVQKLG